MEKILLGLSDAFAQAPYKVLKYKNFILTGLIVITAVLAYGIFTRTTLDMTMESFLPEDDPAQDALNDFREQFGSDDSVFLVYRAKDGNIFSRESLAAAQSLTNDFRNWQDLDRTTYPDTMNGYDLDWNELNHVRRVQSIANIRYQESIDDSLISNRLVPVELPGTEIEITDIRVNALSQEDFLLAFYSANTEYGGILIQTDYGTNPVEGYEPAVDAIDIALDDSFFNFDNVENFDLEFDESVEVADIDFQEPDMLAYTAFHVMTKAIYEPYEEYFEFFPVGTPPLMEFMIEILDEMQLLGVILVLIFCRIA